MTHSLAGFLCIWLVPAVIAILMNSGLVIAEIRSELRLKNSMREQFKPTFTWESVLVGYVLTIIPIVNCVAICLMLAHFYRGWGLNQKMVVKPWTK